MWSLDDLNIDDSLGISVGQHHLSSDMSALWGTGSREAGKEGLQWGEAGAPLPSIADRCFNQP